MNNYNNINITPVLIKKALWGVAAIAIISVGMAFVRPWYNVWCQHLPIFNICGCANNQT